MEFGDAIFRVVIGNEVKSSHRGHNLTELVSLQEQEEISQSCFFFLPVCTKERSCGDIARRPASQEQSSHQKPTLYVPRSWICSLQNLEKVNFCCLSHLICGSSCLCVHESYGSITHKIISDENI